MSITDFPAHKQHNGDTHKTRSHPSPEKERAILMTQWNKWSYYASIKSYPLKKEWENSPFLPASSAPSVTVTLPSPPSLFSYGSLRVLKHRLHWLKASQCLLVKAPSLIKPWMSSRKCFFFSSWFHLVLLNLHLLLPRNTDMLPVLSKVLLHAALLLWMLIPSHAVQQVRARCHWMITLSQMLPYSLRHV